MHRQLDGTVEADELYHTAGQKGQAKQGDLLSCLLLMGFGCGMQAAQRRAHAAAQALEQRVAERTAALEQAMATQQRLAREAQRAEHFAQLGRLAAGVSHELRNPLAAVFLQVDLLEEELRTPSPDDPEAITEALTHLKVNLVRVNE